MNRRNIGISKSESDPCSTARGAIESTLSATLPPLRHLALKRYNCVCFILVLALWVAIARAGDFSGSARLEVSDPSGGLSWNTASTALSVQCWFKLAIPSGTNLTDNMTILVNGQGGAQSSPHAYHIYFNIYTGNIEFATQGASSYTNTLIVRPYLDRWYHVAVVRQNESFTGYVDGREVFSGPGQQAIGNSGTTDGLSIGGWGNGNYLYGEVQEVSIYQYPLDVNFIAQNIFASQPTNDPTLNLKGYFALGYSTNAADSLRNFAPAPIPSGTDSATQAGTGKVTFEETDEAGEQSAFDAQRNGGRDALVPLSGAFSWQQTAFARPTPGISFEFRLGYSSANAFGGYKLGSTDPYAAGSLGPGWRHIFETRVLPAQAFSPLADTDTVGLMRWDGAIDTWDLDYATGQYRTRSSEYRGELLVTFTNLQWTTPERLVYFFRKPDSGPAVMRGRLSSIQDFNSNTVQVLWNETSGVITQVVDSVKGRYTFNYKAGLLTNISFGAWQVNFTYDPTNRLSTKSLTNTAGLYSAVKTTWTFQYGTNGLLQNILDPRDNTDVFVHYDQYGRQTNQVDAINRSTRTEYGVPGKRQIRRTDPGLFHWGETYDRKGRVLAQTDPLTNTTSYAYDEHGNRTSITEPLGWTTYLDYDDRANVVARTNALGQVSQWVFHPFFNKAIQQITPQPPDTNGWTSWTNFFQYDASGNLTNHSDDLGNLVSYSYFTNGLVHTSTDANSNTTTFHYDTNGFLRLRIDPATNNTSFVINDVGWKMHEENALNEPTDYAYDLNGNVARIDDALGRTFLKLFDPNGNLLSASDGKGQLTTYLYDRVNQRTNMTDRTRTNIWTYYYTSRGELERMSDPLTHSVTNTYDAANRLLAVTDQLGHSVTNRYDANGNLLFFFDKLGQCWTKSYDRLNRLRTETDPLGNTRETVYDAAGRVQQIIPPNGYPSLHEYDGRGRLVKWTDPQQLPWLYAYDGVGNITNITDALQGHYVMGYSNRNERVVERNQDNFEWHYTYDELVRLKVQKDPNHVEREVTYDAGGRILFVDFSTGRRDSFTYDDNDNMKTLTRRSGGVTTGLRLGYDPLDRVRQQDDAHGQTVVYGHDPLGRVTTLTYPGNRMLTNKYDALGRLTNQVDWANRNLDYTYDVADRLVSRRYPNGVVQTNGFDSAGRLTALSFFTQNPPTSTNLPIQIALNYAYDRNGNKVGGSESGTLSWPLPSLTDEITHFTPAGRMMYREIQTFSESTNQTVGITYQYDPSGNMTNASGNSQSWSLAYDEDNRTTAINYRAGETSKHIINRYDALGRRCSKTVNGSTTGYVLSLAGGMERVLCDLDGANNVTAWYVHGPDLCYKVDANNELTCYHADAMANILALTDGKTNLVAQYAYTPYGRVLGQTNFVGQIANPYQFVGSQGVMEEMSGLYFMRARYYSADAGVFLSTDPIKKIGPGWKPIAFSYADSNPIRNTDPKGEVPWIAAAAIGWLQGTAASEIEEITRLLTIELPQDLGIQNKYAKPAADIFFGVKDVLETVDEGAKMIAGAASPTGVGAAYFVGNQASKVTAQYLKPQFIWNTYVNIINAAGNALGGVLYNQFGIGTQPSLNLPTPAARNSMASKTAHVAAPIAQAANAASTQGASRTAAGGAGVGKPSTTTDGTYAIRKGDTLGDIAYSYGTTASKLWAINSWIKDPNVIYPGQVLTVPFK
jgi:RHS repeat-associated protein